jgi:hypothetical protein
MPSDTSRSRRLEPSIPIATTKPRLKEASKVTKEDRTESATSIKSAADQAFKDFKHPGKKL